MKNGSSFIAPNHDHWRLLGFEILLPFRVLSDIVHVLIEQNLLWRHLYQDNITDLVYANATFSSFTNVALGQDIRVRLLCVLSDHARTEPPGGLHAYHRHGRGDAAGTPAAAAPVAHHNGEISIIYFPPLHRRLNDSRIESELTPVLGKTTLRNATQNSSLDNGFTNTDFNKG